MVKVRVSVMFNLKKVRFQKRNLVIVSITFQA